MKASAIPPGWRTVRPRRKLRAALVVWRDAEASSGGKPDSSPPPLVLSIGWIEHRPTKARPWWTLSTSRGKTQANGGLKVPAGFVVSVTELLDLEGEVVE